MYKYQSYAVRSDAMRLRNILGFFQTKELICDDLNKNAKAANKAYISWRNIGKPLRLWPKFSIFVGR